MNPPHSYPTLSQLVCLVLVVFAGWVMSFFAARAYVLWRAAIMEWWGL